MFVIGLILLIVGAVIENRDLKLIGLFLIAADVLLGLCCLTGFAIYLAIHSNHF